LIDLPGGFADKLGDLTKVDTFPANNRRNEIVAEISNFLRLVTVYRYHLQGDYLTGKIRTAIAVYVGLC